MRVSSRRISEPYNYTGSCVAVRVRGRCMVFNCLLPRSYLLSLLDAGAQLFIPALIQIFSFSYAILYVVLFLFSAAAPLALIAFEVVVRAASAHARLFTKLHPTDAV